eukprot:14588378-Ditylum_brightwellii.AAC.1
MIQEQTSTLGTNLAMDIDEKEPDVPSVSEKMEPNIDISKSILHNDLAECCKLKLIPTCVQKVQLIDKIQRENHFEQKKELTPNTSTWATNIMMPMTQCLHNHHYGKYKEFANLIVVGNPSKKINCDKFHEKFCTGLEDCMLNK